MQIYNSIPEFQEASVNTPVLTTGTFDGVHPGHRAILSRLNQVANNSNGQSVLLTFSPHPRHVLFPDDNDLKLLCTTREKIELLENTGLQHLIIFPFTKEFSRLSHIEYVRDLLVNGIGVKKLVIGYDHQFGRNREGSFEQLSELAPLYGFEVEEIPAQLVDDMKVSSTRIRKALSEGDVALANQLLGYAYGLEGIVVQGKKLGRELGFPTANLHVPDNCKLIPANGVYAVNIRAMDNVFKGMMNIGSNPTTDPQSANIKLEVHLFGFHGDLYQQMLRVTFIQRLRNEMKFASLEALKIQLNQDHTHARALFNHS